MVDGKSKFQYIFKCTLNTKNEDHKTCYISVNSKVIVILTGYIDRESNGGDALLLYFCCFVHCSLLTAGCKLSSS